MVVGAAMTETFLLLSLLFVLANAFFVASEFAIVKIRPTRLRALAGTGHRRARMALGLTQELDAYLSANQLGITLSSLALGWLGEPAFAGLIEPALVGLGVLAAPTAHTIAIVAAFLVITALHVVVGELAPKSLAIQQTERVALWTALPLRMFYLAMYPLIWLLNSASWAVLRLFRLHRVREIEPLHSPDELRLILQHVELPPSTRRLIDRMFDYTYHPARHVMRPRDQVCCLDVSRPVADNLRAALDNGFSRYPLVDADDRVLGYIHLKDVMAAIASGRIPDDLRRIARQPLFFPADTLLERVRLALQRRRVHLAIITGAHGEFAGIVTLEDLLEDVVGDIDDEQDEPAPA